MVFVRLAMAAVVGSIMACVSEVELPGRCPDLRCGGRQAAPASWCLP